MRNALRGRAAAGPAQKVGARLRAGLAAQWARSPAASLPAVHLPLRTWGRPRPPPIWRRLRSRRSFPAAPGRSAQSPGIWTRARRAAHRLGRPACGRHRALPYSLARSRGSSRAHAAPNPRHLPPVSAGRAPAARCCRRRGRSSSRLGASGGGGVSAAGPGPRDPARFCGLRAWDSAVLTREGAAQPLCWIISSGTTTGQTAS